MRVVTFLMPDYAQALKLPVYMPSGWYYKVEDLPPCGPFPTLKEAAAVGLEQAKAEKHKIHGLVTLPLPFVTS